MPATVMAVIEVLPEGLQHEVLRLLRDRLAHPEARTGQEARQLARGIAALREAAELLLFEADDAGLTETPKLTVGEYRRLAGEHDLGWPSDSTIRRVMGGGSWNAPLRHAYLEAPGDDIVGMDRRAFSWEEVAGAVGEFLDHLRGLGARDPRPTEHA